MKVLIVDDEPLARRRLASLLSGVAGVEVVGEAADGQLALAAVDRHGPDLVLLDIRMPGIDGLEVARRITAGALESGGARPRLVAVSASALVHERRRYTEADFDAFLAKPVRFEELCACLARLLPVRFRYGEVKVPEPVGGGDPLPAMLDLPAELRSRLRRAADRYSATHLEEALAELAARGAEEARAAGILRQRLAEGRFEDIAAAFGAGASPETDARP